MWIRRSLGLAALLCVGCRSPRLALPSVERAVPAPVATIPSRSLPPIARAATAPVPPRDYAPEVGTLPQPSNLPAPTWPPRGITAESGIKNCRRWHGALGKLCSAEGDPRRALVTLAERAQVPGDLKTPGRSPRRLRELEDLSAELFRLEGCQLPLGIVRLLRAQWLPECAEDLASSVLRTRSVQLEPSVRLSLYGEALGAACTRIPQPMPVYRGHFDKLRLAQFLEKSVRPWQARTLRSLEVCGDAAKALPRQTYSREAALRGYVRALHQFAALHRNSPIDETIKRDWEQRTAYYGALDDAAEVAWNRLSEALREYGAEFAFQGNYGYGREVSSFSQGFQRESLLSRLGLPMVPATSESDVAAVARFIPQPAALWLLSRDDLRQPAVLGALVQQGLPQSTRAIIGQALASMPTTDSNRKAAHALLAQVLVRIGLVTRQNYLFERAVVELTFAESTPENRLLSAIARTLSSLDTEALMGHPQRNFRDWPPLDLSPLLPARLLLDGRRDLMAIASLNHAYLSLVGASDGDDDSATKQFLALTRESDRPELRAPERRCAWDFLSRCTMHFRYFSDPRIEDERCDCIPWPWRVTDATPSDK
jgi:hypothetical protein